jgi:hypothetical protein
MLGNVDAEKVNAHARIPISQVQDMWSAQALLALPKQSFGTPETLVSNVQHQKLRLRILDKRISN